MSEDEKEHGKAQKVQTSISHQAASCHHQRYAFEIFVIMIVSSRLFYISQYLLRLNF